MQKLLDGLCDTDIDIADDLMDLSFSNLKMIKVISVVLKNVCMHTDDVSGREQQSKSSVSRRKNHKKQPVMTSQTAVI